MDGNGKMERYVSQVLSGELPACKNIRRTCERHRYMGTLEDVWFDPEPVNAFVSFCESLTINDGHFLNGQKLKMLDWQAFVIGSLLGWKWAEDNAVVFKECWIEVARGASKTSLMGLLALFIATQKHGSETVILANKREQAQLALDSAKRFISPTTIPHASIYNELRVGTSSIKALASKVTNLDGLRFALAILDEQHEASDDVFSKIISALPKNRDAQMVSISTAGGPEKGLESIYYTTRRVAEECLRDFDKLRSVFSFLCQIDEDDDIEDETCWIKAQPSMGHIVSVQDYRRSLESYAATNNLQHFERFLCCRYSQLNANWIDVDVLEAVEEDISLEDFKGQDIFVGIDLSKSFDISTVAVMAWRNGTPHIFMHHWIPAQGARKAYRSHAKFLNEWKALPFINIVETPTIDYDHIAEFLCYLRDNFNLQKDSIGVDALGGMKFTLQEWEQKYKLPIIGIPQTITVLGPATLTLESLIREGNIRIRKDPCWKHCVASVALQEGVNGDRRPTKADSTGQIDAVIAALQALVISIEHGAMKPAAYRTAEEINI